MENLVTCPTCKTSYEIQPDHCDKCGFPFSGTDHEKSVFIGQQILKKSKVTDTKDHIKRARIILWSVGAINMIAPFIFYAGRPLYEVYVILGIIIGLIFIGFGFSTYQRPFISILIPTALLLLYYIIMGISNPEYIIHGIIWKFLILGVLIYALISILEAEHVKKESKFLKDQKYK